MRVQKYILLDQIGSGAFSTVYKAQHIESKQLYAIKSMKDMPRNNEEAVRNEIELIKKINHKNLVKYVTDFKEKGKWYIVFEYCGKGDLKKFKKKQGRLPEFLCRNMVHSLVEILSLLHQNKIVHRDLKMENILINDYNDFKLADFGFSKDTNAEMMISFCGTPTAMAPQILKLEPYDQRCDTWSLGIMLYEMIYGNLPFLPTSKHGVGVGITELTACVLHTQPSYNKRIEVSAECLDFLKLCLKKNRRQRPRMRELAKHPWLLGYNSQIHEDMIIDYMEDQTQLVNKVKQILNCSVQEHINKLIVRYQLLGTQISKYLHFFDKYFSDCEQIKTCIVLMMKKIIHQLLESQIQIEIQEFKLVIKLDQITSFKEHIEQLRELLASQMKTSLSSMRKINIQKQIFMFVSNNCQACLRLTENYPEKIQLLYYLSKLPIYKPSPSSIEISLSAKEENPKSHKFFVQVLQNLKENKITEFINGHYCDEDIRSHWLMEHKFHDERRDGVQIQIGMTISKVIEFSLKQSYPV